MKKIIARTITVLILGILVFSFTGCGIIGLLINPEIGIRITAFETTLNADPRIASAIALNFAPATETVMRGQIEDIEFWNTEFDPDNTFSFEIIDALDTDAVAATMTESYLGESLAETEVTFKMYKTDDGEWLIEEFHEDGTAVIRLAQPE